MHTYELRNFSDSIACLPKQPSATSNKLGRNKPCPCGSNKKYKKCCLNAKWIGCQCDWNYIGLDTEQYLRRKKAESIKAKRTLTTMVGLANAFNR